MSEKTDVAKLYKDYVLPTYGWYGINVEKGAGSRVWDDTGKCYLDFFPGWAVSGLGHCHPVLAKAIKEQADTLIHIPNTFYNKWQGLLAKKIADTAFDGKVFFSNSGAEANEAAVKFARKYGDDTGRYEIITFEKSFHGRTLGMIAATAQEKVRQGFGPVLEGFKYVPFNDLDEVKATVGDKTVAIMLEPVQGEGGVNIADEDFINGIKKLADEKDLLLIFDEVQTGMGRTGENFAYQLFDMEPDLMSLAKSLGGGVAVGATLINKKCAAKIAPGMHGSTFGGNPIACASALAVFKVMEDENILDNVANMGDYLRGELAQLCDEFPNVVDSVRGVGLMVGVELKIDGMEIFNKCLLKGLIINCTQGNVLRVFPALNVIKEDIDESVAILKDVLREVS